jgi:hypothetical protein
MDKKILFIGDSFVDGLDRGFNPEPNQSIHHFWNEKGFLPFFLGSSSRSVQTILEIWTKYIPYLTTYDLLVIILPNFSRTRLPYKECRRLIKNPDLPVFNDYFIGSKSYTHKENFLEIWDNNYDNNYFDKKLEIQELINGSNASILNYLEVIDSLCKMTKCKKIIHCWDYKKFDSDNIIYREEMTELIGTWDTRGQVYERTNGREGDKGDGHWSDDMNIKFMNFLIKYFNND